MKKAISINELHNIFYKRIPMLHSFFIKNNIEYYAVGGTALGARRHNGFIPWDDDMDLAMKRQHYDNFLKIAKQLDSRFFEVKNYKFSKKVDFPLTRIFLVGIENGLSLSSKKYDKRIYIDVFPLDYISNDLKEQKAIIKKNKRLISLLYFKSRAFAKQKLLKKIALLFVKIFLLPFTDSFLCQAIDRLVSSPQRKKNANTNILWTSGGVYSFDRETHSVTIYGKPTLHKFGSTFLFVPEKLDDFLIENYGHSYMTPIKRESQNHFCCYLTDDYQDI